MGQEILKQQQELEERIQGFEEEEEEGEEEVGETTKSKLKELDDAMRSWESQNEGMMRELGGKVSWWFASKRSSLTLSPRFPLSKAYLTKLPCPNPRKIP